ncbi:polyprenyl synthetase family protein [Streptomyces sp. NPDC091266]|uniref:polyprenyl synthetase family protein n=1 Tax=Streptomyces sp. NPDC091266 TaxID=3365978 RepID=UPI003825547B
MADEFARRWPENTTGLDAVHRYALLPSGKLLRPHLLARSALAVGGSLEAVLPAAVGFEVTHTGSLLHDDIIDQDAVRRGRPAVHVAFGPEMAIVAGNALIFTWFAALAECAAYGIPHRRIVGAMEIQAAAGQQICRGAALELSLVGDLEASLETYSEMARAKTAALFEAACQVGAILGGGEAPQIAALGVFGDHLGCAFQIRDDLLPYREDGAGGGKPADSDLRNRRPTLPVLLAHREATPAQRAVLRACMMPGPDEGEAFGRLAGVLRATGALDAAEQSARHHAEQARRALAEIPPSADRDALQALTTTVDIPLARSA